MGKLRLKEVIVTCSRSPDSYMLKLGFKHRSSNSPSGILSRILTSLCKLKFTENFLCVYIVAMVSTNI